MIHVLKLVVFLRNVEGKTGVSLKFWPSGVHVKAVGDFAISLIYVSSCKHAHLV